MSLNQVPLFLANVTSLDRERPSFSLLPCPRPLRASLPSPPPRLPPSPAMSKTSEIEKSDEDLDREWKGSQGNASQRPQSTMARSFSLALNDLFKIDGSLADLDAAVDQKKRAVSSQTSELEALEARLKATEERLKAATASSPGRLSPRQRMPVGDMFSPPKEHPTSPLATEFQSTSSPRTNTKNETRRTESYNAALPPTPGPSEGESDSEYVVVHERGADKREDGDVTETSRQSD